jgi:hypothetical protein
MKTFLSVLSAVVVSSVMSLVVVSQVSASNGVGAKPANPVAGQPRTQDIFIYQLGLGASKTDEVVVSNNSNEMKTVELYATDGIVTNTGAFSCKQLVEPRKDVGAWISINKKEVKLKPSSSDKIPFTVAIPNMTTPGEHNGCLVFSTKDDNGDQQGNVHIRTRSAIRVAITIPGDLRKEVSIDSFTVSTSNDNQTYNLNVRNTGNVSADTTMNVTLRSLFGQTIYSNQGSYPVLPSELYELQYVNRNMPFWGGWYNATAKISYDESPVASEEATKSIKVIEHPARLVFIQPHPLALLFYGGIAVATIALAFIGAKYIVHKRRNKLEWKWHTVKQGETIESLAESAGTDWKTLTRKNSIKAPYTLDVGTKIKIPKRK